MTNEIHIPVLTEEVIKFLPQIPGLRVVDATLGGGGHAAAIANARPDVRILGIEWDPQVAAAFPGRHPELRLSVTVVHDSYVNMERICADQRFVPDAVLMDLGLSSWHYESSGRGFSFLRDEPLDMRFDPTAGGPTAADILNGYDKPGLETILRELGEERFAPDIASAIFDHRRREPFRTTGQLVSVIEGAVPAWYRHQKIHCATRTFQALRMQVNRELENLAAGLGAALRVLRPGGRLMVISFHGGDDKLVRETFKEAVKAGRARWVQRATVRPSWAEIRSNPRARSAKLKIIETV